MAIRSLSDLTWKDAILMELESARVRIEGNRPMPEMTILRLASMLRDEWPRELERLNAKSKK